LINPALADPTGHRSCRQAATVIVAAQGAAWFRPIQPYDVCSLQLRYAGEGAVFVLLPGAATDAAGTLDDTIAYDRNRSLTHDDVAALRRDNPAQSWLVGAIRHLAARTAKGSRGGAVLWRKSLTMTGKPAKPRSSGGPPAIRGTLLLVI
jgi:hypothetical protein